LAEILKIFLSETTKGYSRKKCLLGAERPWNLGVPPIDLN
jgi:hypothetical protein